MVTLLNKYMKMSVNMKKTVCRKTVCNFKYIETNLVVLVIVDEENKENEKYNMPAKYVGLMSLKLNKICQYAANKLKKDGL